MTVEKRYHVPVNIQITVFDVQTSFDTVEQAERIVEIKRLGIAGSGVTKQGELTGEELEVLRGIVREYDEELAE